MQSSVLRLRADFVLQLIEGRQAVAQENRNEFLSPKSTNKSIENESYNG